VERFNESLRDEVDLPGIVERLNPVVNQVIGPHHVSVWLLDSPQGRTVPPP